MRIGLDAQGTFHTRPDRLRRYGLLVLAPILVALAAVAPPDARLEPVPRLGSIVLLVGAALCLLLGYGRYTLKLRVTTTGVELDGWWSTRRVAFVDVRECCLGSTEESFHFGEFPDYEWGGLFIHILYSLTLRPVLWIGRTIIRAVWFDPNEVQFFDVELCLLGEGDKAILTIDGADRFVAIHDAWHYITARTATSSRARWTQIASPPSS